jgi:hypothetical protein
MFEFRKPTIYMSHSIFGTDGKVEENCERAIKVANKIRHLFPEIGIYCPAESEIVLWTLREMKVLNVKDILEADCKILQTCHGWMWIYTSPSKGCNEEFLKAHKAFKLKEATVGVYKEIIMTDLLKANFSEVRRLVSPIVEAAKSRFRKGNE